MTHFLHPSLTVAERGEMSTNTSCYYQWISNVNTHSPLENGPASSVVLNWT